MLYVVGRDDVKYKTCRKLVRIAQEEAGKFCDGTTCSMLANNACAMYTCAMYTWCEDWRRRKTAHVTTKCRIRYELYTKVISVVECRKESLFCQGSGKVLYHVNLDEKRIIYYCLCCVNYNWLRLPAMCFFGKCCTRIGLRGRSARGLLYPKTMTLSAIS